MQIGPSSIPSFFKNGTTYCFTNFKIRAKISILSSFTFSTALTSCSSFDFALHFTASVPMAGYIVENTAANLTGSFFSTASTNELMYL